MGLPFPVYGSAVDEFNPAQKAALKAEITALVETDPDIQGMINSSLDKVRGVLRNRTADLVASFKDRKV